MYLKKSYNKVTGRTYLSIAQKYRHPVKKVATDRNVKSLGYLDELKKVYDDPVAHFKDVAILKAPRPFRNGFLNPRGSSSPPGGRAFPPERPPR